MDDSWPPLPDDFLDREQFCAHLAETYDQPTAATICSHLTADEWHCYWINPLIADDPGELPGEALAQLPGLFKVPRSQRISHHPAAGSGHIYIQNPSSYFAAKVLNAQSGDEVLDLAAAPGGKTAVLAVAMINSGRIAAVEPVKGRFHRLRANLARLGVSNVQFYQRDGRGVGRAVPERFDRVLLDAPCSSEAHIRWHDTNTYRQWSLRKVKECQRKQKSLIRSAYAALKPGGCLLYCTCSFAVEENELVVEHLLNKTDAEVLPIADPPDNSEPGKTAWRGKSLASTLAQTRRILPDGLWDGFYLARLSKPA